MANFKDSLKDGKNTELDVKKIINKKYPGAYIVDGYFKEYDIFVPEKNFGIEVKKDVKSQETGNYVIEIEFNGKPSALSTTKAKYWVIYDGECYVWIKPSKLYGIISIHGEGKLARFIGEGDTKYKRAYLLPKELIKKYATKVYYLKGN